MHLTGIISFDDGEPSAIRATFRLICSDAHERNDPAEQRRETLLRRSWQEHNKPQAPS
jgi:hypothetical protein